MVNNNSHNDDNIPPSNDSEGSSKKRKHDATENDVSALRDSTSHKLSDILPIALNLFKGNDAKSMKIKCNTTNGNVCDKINDGNSFAKSSKEMNKKQNASTTSLSQRKNGEVRNVE